MKDDSQNKSNDELKEVTQSLRYAKWILLFGILFIIVSPIIFTLPLEWYVLKGSGEIGDVIGGITAPIAGVMGSVLVYYALRAQIKANEIIQKQINTQETEKIKEVISSNIGQLYSNFKNGVADFEYSTLDKGMFGENKYVKGAEAFYKMFHDIYCKGHIDISDLETNPKITELISLLEVCHVIFEKLSGSNINDKEVLWLLTKQQFENIICPRIKDKDEDGVNRWYCDKCEDYHGLPKNLADIIINIRKQISL